jgi:hypothetical protein
MSISEASVDARHYATQSMHFNSHIHGYTQNQEHSSIFRHTSVALQVLEDNNNSDLVPHLQGTLHWPAAVG